MKKITKKQSIEFNKKAIELINKLGFNEVKNNNSLFIYSGNIETKYGKYSINLTEIQECCFTIFGRFENSDLIPKDIKDKFDIGCSSKLNFHVCNGDNLLKFFEITINELK